MTTWSTDYLPQARGALTDLRGPGPTDGLGLAVPALSVIDATSVLAVLTKGVLVQLNRWSSGDFGPAARTYLLDDNGAFNRSANGPAATLKATDYLAGFPPPTGATQSGSYYRSPQDYTLWGNVGAASGDTGAATDMATAWGQAFAGTAPDGSGYISPGTAVYCVYMPNGYDDPSGQLFETRELVNAYQRACDAIAAGAATGPDMTVPMPSDAQLAFWNALLQVGASLDTLADVPPPPPTSQVLAQAIDDAATFVGQAIAAGANVAGEVVGNAAKGIAQGLGVWGIAAAIAALAVFFAVR